MTYALILGLKLFAPSVAIYFTTPYFSPVKRAVASLFFPAAMIGTFFAAQAYFNSALGPPNGPSDDGRGIGTAFIYIVAIPLGLAMNALLILLFKRQSQQSQTNVSSEETL